VVNLLSSSQASAIYEGFGGTVDTSDFQGTNVSYSV
jgi:hypothetical protein